MVTLSATDLPAGLVLDPASGSITGRPNALGTFTVTLTATHGALTATQSFSWVVKVPAIVIAGIADLPRLQKTVRFDSQPDGMIDLDFARKPDLASTIVLEGTDEFGHWHEIADTGWLATAQPDGTELVRISHACCLITGHRHDQAFFRFRVGL